MVSLAQAIDLRALKPTQMLTIKKELVTSGSGILQWRPVGTKISLKDTARLMIVNSDNVATNMIIDALGGKEKINEDFTNWGLKQTKINNWLVDLEGTNKTSPYDLVYLLSRVDRGELISEESRKWMYDLMYHAHVRTLLIPGLGPGARLAHKTGDIGKMVGDTGIVTASDGTKYYVAMQVERPHNDLRANEYIRNASKLVYGRFANTSNLSDSTEPATLAPTRLLTPKHIKG
jgi:beta-lactamase class A